MIPNLKMGYYHQKEYLERPCNIQMSEKLARKPMERFELLTSRTYSVLSYLVGGFVGSKSQMNHNKHNLSYDLSAAVLNLLNPCKYEREKSLRRSIDSFYNTATKFKNSESCTFSKYIVKSSHNEKMIGYGLELLHNCLNSLDGHYYNSKQTKDFNCDENKHSHDGQSTTQNSKTTDCLENSVDVTDRVSVRECETPKREHSINYLASERFRQHSECSVESTDSESFIVFDGPDQDDKRIEDNWKLENFDFDSEDNDAVTDDDDEDDDDDDDNEDDDDGDGNDDDNSCDDFDTCSVDKELAEANDRWLKNYKDVETQDEEGKRKVRFSDDVKINKIVAWDYAYRAARAGPWEQMARDRARFRERILRLSPTISPVFRKEHRDRIYKELYS